MKDIEDRRAFLKTLGVAIPAFAASSGPVEAVAARDPPARLAGGDPRGPIIRADEVFTIYVSEALAHLPAWLATDPHSTVRAIIEAQAAGLAAVIIEMEKRQ